MRNSISNIALAVSLALAITLTFSCSGDELSVNGGGADGGGKGWTGRWWSGYGDSNCCTEV